MFGQKAWPRVGLMTTPHATGGTGTAHATYTGRDIAVCGAPTPFLGKPWPRIGEYWDLSYRRCPACAHRMYTPARH